MTGMLKKIQRVDRSPMNPKVWCVQLECGHELWVYKKPRKDCPGLKCGKGEAAQGKES